MQPLRKQYASRGRDRTRVSPPIATSLLLPLSLLATSPLLLLSLSLFLPRTADRNPKTTFHLWHVSLPHALRTLEADMLRTLNHLHGRLAHENWQLHSLRARGTAPHDGNGASLPVAPAEPCASAEHARTEHGSAELVAELAAGLGPAELDAEARATAARADRLEASLLKLHHTVLLLRVL